VPRLRARPRFKPDEVVTLPLLLRDAGRRLVASVLAYEAAVQIGEEVPLKPLVEFV